MPVLRCYVSDDTMRILEREIVRRGSGETPEHLAEYAIAEAAIRAAPRRRPSARTSMVVPTTLTIGTIERQAAPVSSIRCAHDDK